MEKEKNKLQIYTWEEIKEIYFKKKFDNLILFSQPRSGSTFVSNVLAKELNYEKNFFPEELFLDQHFVYLKYFIKKHNNFFLHINEYWVRRTDLIKENTMYLYLYRNTEEILNSYEKAKKLNYYLGWEEMINKYRKFFPEIKGIQSAPLFGHKVWELQINKFNDAYTLSYDSFKTHKYYLDSGTRNSQFKRVKDIEVSENLNIKKKFTDSMEGKIPHFEKERFNFNLLEKFYFYIRRRLESKKKNRKNF
tara:strand:- start:4377 stop:5123 length:747 start_codon:yes stop_codon:yes gene_type:complete